MISELDLYVLTKFLRLLWRCVVSWWGITSRWDKTNKLVKELHYGVYVLICILTAAQEGYMRSYLFQSFTCSLGCLDNPFSLVVRVTLSFSFVHRLPGRCCHSNLATLIPWFPTEMVFGSAVRWRYQPTSLNCYREGTWLLPESTLVLVRGSLRLRHDANVTRVFAA